MKQITRRRPLCRLECRPGDDPHDDPHGDPHGNHAAHLHPLLRRIFENRNVQTLAELDYSLNRLHPPQQLKGIEAATALLLTALADDQKIVVVGDYDTDGATATAVALLGLRALGAGRVEYLAPNRFEYGYGLSAEIAEVALGLQPDLVVTVDNGISSIAGVARLRAAGVPVIVTDHHLAGAELPDANAIVNPNQPGCGFPSKALAGVGVMFYLLLAVRAGLRRAGRFNGDGGGGDGCPEPNLAELLDLVALGTVADLVPLDYNNRILVAQGVARVRGGRCRPGIKALMEVAGKRCQSLDASDFGFIIGPRLNAAGRMADISTGIECLLADDPGEALGYARLLDDMNRARRHIERSMHEQAARIVARLERRNDGNDGDAGDPGDPGNVTRRGWCLFDPEWHQGVVGLVATRIREKSNQPAVVFAPADGGWLRGSARSVPGLHIRDLLEAISTRDPGLIEKFGGHAMAAGLTIAAKNFEAFAAQFGELVGAHFKDRAPSHDLFTDGELAAEHFTLETAELVRAASPWGQHFPAPLFDGEFRVTAQRIVGHQHLKLTLAPLNGAGQGHAPIRGAGEFDAIVFRYVEPGEDAPPLDTVKAAYQLQVNEYQGRRALQLRVEYLQPCATESKSESESESEAAGC